MNSTLGRARIVVFVICGAATLMPALTYGHSGDDAKERDVATLTASQQAVADVLTAYAQAYAETDITGIRGLIVDDARFSYFEGAGADADWSEYAAHLEAEMPSFSNASYVFSDIAPEVSGDMAFATFSWVLDVVILSDQFEGGRHPVSMSGLGTAVLLSVGGDWRLRHLHTARKAAPRS